MDNRFFTHPILNSPYAYPAQHAGTGRQGAADPADHPSPPHRQVRGPTSRGEEAKGGRACSRKLFVDHALTERGQQYDPSRSSTTCAARSMPGAAGLTPPPGRLPRKPLVCSSTGDTTPFSPSALFLSGRGGGNRHLADRGRAPHRQNRNPLSRPPGERQQRRQPRIAPPGLSLATGAGKTTVMAAYSSPGRPSMRCDDPTAEIHPRLSRERPASPSATGCACSSPTIRTATTRVGNWCRPICSPTSSGPESSSPTTTPSSCASGWRSPRAAGCSSGPHRRTAADPGERRADAATGHARVDGVETDTGAQRRGPPLLQRPGRMNKPRN